MKTNLFNSAVQKISSFFESRQSKMARELDNFVEELNELFQGYQNQKQIIREIKFQEEQFLKDNTEVDFSLNNRQNAYRLSHWWIILLILFCIAADFYIMREVASQFGIANPNLGVLVGFMLLSIELTLAALSFKRPGTNDKLYIFNQIGKFLFLLFIPAMAYLIYKQNQSNQLMGATEISLELVRGKMIVISSFSLLIHLLLVLNLEKGFIAAIDMITIHKWERIKEDIKKEFEILKKVTGQLQSTGGVYLRARERYNNLYPRFSKRIEFLPDGLISLINDGQSEDVISLKQSQLTQVKAGYTRGDLIRLTMSKSVNNQYTGFLGGIEQQIVQIPEEKVIQSHVKENNMEGIAKEPEPTSIETYESFFSNKEKTI